MNYLLFAGSNYYPAGGWQDLQGTYKTLQEALEHTKTICRASWGSDPFDWYHVVEVSTLKVVAYWDAERAIRQAFYKHCEDDGLGTWQADLYKIVVDPSIPLLDHLPAND